MRLACKVFVCFLLFSQAALAATITGSLPITASVVSNCTFGAITSVAFGSYDPTSASPDTANGSITVTCTNGTAYDIGLDAGTFPGATVTTRQMTGSPPGTPLSYGLFQDAAFTTNWGDTIGTDTVTGTGTGAAIARTVYGRIPALQAVTTGSYADTVLITVTF